MNTKKIIAIGEIIVGFIMASPIDEAAVGVATGGASIPSATAQLSHTYAIGTALIGHGLSTLFEKEEEPAPSKWKGAQAPKPYHWTGAEAPHQTTWKGARVD